MWDFPAYYFDMGFLGTGEEFLNAQGEVERAARMRDPFTGAQCEVGSNYWTCRAEGKYNPKFKFAGRVAINHFEQITEVVGEQAEILKGEGGCYNIITNNCKQFAKELAKRIEGSPPPSPGPSFPAFDMEVNEDVAPDQEGVRFRMVKKA
ncbi:MAG: hypothetical protein Q9198_008903 [Flavoplaca austrocitrina]